jgi:hypothetical protein
METVANCGFVHTAPGNPESPPEDVDCGFVPGGKVNPPAVASAPAAQPPEAPAPPVAKAGRK